MTDKISAAGEQALCNAIYDSRQCAQCNGPHPQSVQVRRILQPCRQSVNHV
jgi:hypothetical protein